MAQKSLSIWASHKKSRKTRLSVAQDSSWSPQLMRIIDIVEQMVIIPEQDKSQGNSAIGSKTLFGQKTFPGTSGMRGHKVQGFDGQRRQGD